MFLRDSILLETGVMGAKWGKIILSLDNKFCLNFRVKLNVFLAAAELNVAE